MHELSPNELPEILSHSGVLLECSPGDPQALPFSRIQVASDKESFAPGSLALAYCGLKVDRHQSLLDWQGQGARCFVCEDPGIYTLLKAKGHSWVYLVKSSRVAWPFIEAALHGNPERHLEIAGITGTNGKSSTLWYLRWILEHESVPLLAMGTLGLYFANQHEPGNLTSPDPGQLFSALAKARKMGYTHAAAEVSSHALSLGKWGPARFRCSGFTSFSRDHLDFHGSMADYWNSKLKIFNQTDGPVFIAEALRPHFNDIQAPGPGTLQWLKAPAEPQLSVPYATNAWMALALAEKLLNRQLNPSILASLPTVPGRMEEIAESRKYGFELYVDFAHTPEALENLLKSVKAKVRGRVIVVFGCGGDRDRGKRSLMGAVAANFADLSVITNDNPRSEDPEKIAQEICKGMGQAANHVELDRAMAIEWALFEAKPGDGVILAGKGHEETMIIGDKLLAFSDRDEAKKALAKLA